MELPDFLEPILRAPEFERLGSIRLLNCDSLEIAALSEVRRRSHTIGVLHLGTRIAALEFSSAEVRALLFAIILHDIGTPPFGHTLEYEFIRKYELDHESKVSRILDLTHHPLSADHQIYKGRVAAVASLLAKTGVEDTVRAILLRKHPLSAYLFGDIDLDNIDNVYRMAHYLGNRVNPRTPLLLASSIDVNRLGEKLLSINHRGLIDDWLHWRAVAYRALLDTVGHRRNQAVLSRIVCEALTDRTIDEDDWFLTDEGLLDRLKSSRKLRSFFADLGKSHGLRELEFWFTPDRKLSRTELMNYRDELVRGIEAEFKTPWHRTTCYVALVSYGEALSRRLVFVDPQTREEWITGEPQATYRLHVYFRHRILKPKATADRQAFAKATGPEAVEGSIIKYVREFAEAKAWSLRRTSTSFEATG